MQWYIRDKLVMDQADPDAIAFRTEKLRKLTAEIARIESDNKANSDSRITTDELATVRREESNVIRLHLNRIPGRVAAAAETDAATVEDLVADEITSAMAAICNDGDDDYEHDSEGAINLS
jgi:hypothetical protein